MNESDSMAMREGSRRFAAAIVALIVSLFILHNLPWHLDDYDQAKQAFTSFEMVKLDHWWLQHTPTERIATKPPLGGWISSAFYFLTGQQSWAAAWRLPSLICALLILAMLWRKGSALFGNPQGGLLAIAAFGLTVFTPRLATLVRTDMMLTTSIFVTGYLILQQIGQQQPWGLRQRCALFGIVLASMLLKGPIAYAFLLPGLVAYAFCAYRLKLPNHAWSGFWSWFAPLLFFIGWAAIGFLQSPEFYDQVVVKEFLGRFTTGENAVHQPRNPFYYIGLIAYRWQPWSLVIIGLISLRPIREAFRRDPELLWLTCWTLGGLLFMSAVPSKRFDRILPVIPPLCLLLVAMARHLPLEFAQPPKLWTWIHRPLSACTRIFPLTLQQACTPWILGAVACAALIATSYTLVEVQKGYRTHQDALVVFGENARDAARGEPLAVVSGKDEGMLLYTDQTQFTRLNDAIEGWQSGKINWLILPQKIFVFNKQRLSGFTLAAESGVIADKNSAYVLLTRHRKPHSTSPAAAPSR